MNINTGILEGLRRISLRVRDLAVDGVPGAPLAMRLRGATLAGPPATGTWRPGDTVTDRNGFLWICTAGGTPGTWLAGLQKVAATPVAGVALVNGTPNIVSWTAPNDGQLHRVLVMSSQQVTTAETGGAVAFDFTAPSGTARAFTIFAAAQPTGDFSNFQGLLVKANTTAVLTQSSALTAGAATVWCEIWAA